MTMELGVVRPLAEEEQAKREALAVSRLTGCLVGESQNAEAMRNFAVKAAKTDHTILLTGETGVGKDMLAELIHRLGGQKHRERDEEKSREFVAVDCGALTANLTESELFGHARGAFTDAREEKRGLIEIAEHGTLFFNEVANMTLPLQAKFLRIIEKKSYRPVGGLKTRGVNARIIAATNADLEESVMRGEFRPDLFHRLNVVSLHIPPLRDRPEDIEPLAQRFLEHFAPHTKFSQDAIKALNGYGWPGNVRELENAVERAVFNAQDKVVEARHLGLSPTSLFLPQRDGPIPTLFESTGFYLKRLLIHCRGNVIEASHVAGVARTKMYKLIKAHGLNSVVRESKKQPED